MAISIDSVYKEVLNIIKNEDVEKGYESSQRSFVRRPYLTPLEFNQFARRAQLDIYENYIDKYKQASMTGDQENLEFYQSKLDLIRSYDIDVNKSTGQVSGTPIYVERIYDYENGVEYEEVTKDYFEKVKRYTSSKAFLLTSASGAPKNHIYYRKGSTVVEFHPTPDTNPNAIIISLPSDPNWNYTVANNEVIINLVGTVDFTLNKEDRSTLVNKILELAAMSYREPGIADLALRNESTNVEDKIQ